MKLFFNLLLIVVVLLFTACHSTKKIQTAIAQKDTVAFVRDAHADSMAFIKETYSQFLKNQIVVTGFSAKINVDYQGSDGKKNVVNAFLRIKKDSAIWISINGALGVEGLRVLVDKDSVKILNKLDREYQSRSMAYLQEITGLPLDLQSMQNLLLGNAIFFDSNIISYATNVAGVSLLHEGSWFRHLISLSNQHTILSSKLNDRDLLRNRTCFLYYSDYENLKGINFSTNRMISVTDKNKLDIILHFKQYEFNEVLSLPFSIPKNYKRIK